MWVFAHLRKCAGTSVVNAVAEAGLRLPPSHKNGHPAGADGHAIAGMSSMSPDAVAGMMLNLSATGVEFVALEWDFPRMEAFPAGADLRFFTIFRDPVERLLSNYAFDVTSRFTASRSIWDYMRGPAIWQSDNYYTRFFASLTSTAPVRTSDVDYAAAVLTTHFRFAFFGDDLGRFLSEDVALPVRSLGRDNRTNGVLRLVNRSHLQVSAAERQHLRERNAADYALLAAIRDATARTHARQAQ